jgi:acyl-CoA thioester hydrolase
MSMFRFSIKLTVKEADVNDRQHVSFDRYFVFFNEARIAYLAMLGYYFDAGPRSGVIAINAHCAYRKELRLGDEITVGCKIREIKKKSFVMEFVISMKDHPCAEGDAAFLYFDYENRKVTAFPPQFIEDVQSHEGLIEPPVM